MKKGKDVCFLLLVVVESLAGYSAQPVSGAHGPQTLRDAETAIASILPTP